MQKLELPLTSKLHTTIKNMMKDLNVPGAAVAIVKNGEVVFSEGYGFRDTKNKKAVTSKTLFAIGSSTKAFGTLSLSLLAQQQKFNWDTPVQTYIPTFSLHDPLASAQITARDLASHRTGVSRHDTLWYISSLTRQEIAEKICHLELDAPFRSAFLYNNLMYAMISYIAENITNQTWEQYVTEHILDPLQMERTNFSVTTSQKSDDHALPYIEKDGNITEVPFCKIDTIGAAGCMNSNIEDMAKWVLLHLNKGKVGEHELIMPDMLQQMYTPYIPIPDEPMFAMPECPLNSYGLGWFISAYRGHKEIHHGGNIDGFSALVSFMPEHNIGLVVLTNSGHTLLPSYLAHQIYDELLGLEPIDWHKRAIEDTAKFNEIMKEMNKPLPQVKETVLSHPLKDYIGTFEHPAYGTIEIHKRNETLYLKFASFDIEMKHHHYDMFSTKWNVFQMEMNILISYEMNTAGELNELKLHLPATLSTKPLLFTKIGK
ncbi:serine hydrolase [Bacillus sp. 3103sda1]|uniref:serine hydrolase n=1 Tax=Bacillus sp. 3103sda1 TaxID=2953808 RepID=UPI00209EFAB9|nr:serine hydrolase [Bacillus sp. 3103sda1]MCP1123599.1 serine hydrolase [Bacillus sp. 3103sda1]